MLYFFEGRASVLKNRQVACFRVMTAPAPTIFSEINAYLASLDSNMTAVEQIRLETNDCVCGRIRGAKGGFVGWITSQDDERLE